MRDAARWQPTKFERGPRGLRGSRDPTHLAASSRIVADAMAPRYQRMLERHARGSLLDLGAGLVPLFGVYRDLVDDVTCVDWEKSQQPSPYIDVHADLAERLPFPDASFDTILMTDVLEHLPEPDRAFREVRRLLRPRGKLLLGVPFLYWIHERPHDYARYTDEMLRLFVARVELRLLELEAAGGSPEVFCDLLVKHVAVVAPLAGLAASACARLLNLRVVQRLSDKSSSWFPIGYVLVAERD